MNGKPSQREIDAYYAQHEPCPSCGRTWSTGRDDAWTIIHHPDCEFIAAMNEDIRLDDEIALD